MLLIYGYFATLSMTKKRLFAEFSQKFTPFIAIKYANLTATNDFKISSNAQILNANVFLNANARELMQWRTSRWVGKIPAVPEKVFISKIKHSLAFVPFKNAF